jgi:hypothetical protein
MDFVDADLRGARFTRSLLGGAVLRGVDVDGADLDSPWLSEGTFVVNGVDVVPLVEAELDRLFPGRSLRHATDPEGLRAAWAALERTWAATLDHVATLPPQVVDVTVAGEWSFAQTLRHLVMATDTWLRGAVLRIEQPYHPIGQPNVEYYSDGHDPTVFAAGSPTWAEVLEARADRMAMVRGYLDTVTAADLTGLRQNPWAPQHQETVLSCLGTILAEEWEHHRYAVRDLAVAAAG